MKLYCVLLLAASFFLGTEASAQAPNVLSYQGLLTTAGGTPVPDGVYKLQFDLFTAATGGVAFWTEVDSGIAVQRGTFSVLLGAATALPDSFHRPLYVQVTALAGPGIGSASVFSPRSSLASAPSALGLRTPATLIDSASLPMLTITNNNRQGLLVESSNSNGVNRNSYSIEGRSTNAFGLIGVGVDNASGIWGYTGSPSTLWYDSYAGIGGYGHGHSDGIGGISDSGYAVAGYTITPAAWGGAFFGKLYVGAPSGDTSVQLPDNSIASHEILDKPGLASHGTPFFFLLPSVGTRVAVDSVTITIPAVGYVVIDAGGSTGINHTNGQNSEVDCFADTSPQVFSDFVSFQAGFVPATLPTDYYYQSFHCHRVVARGAGTYSFFLNAVTSSGTGTCYIGEHWITATYYSTSYGPVSELLPSGEFSASSGSVPPRSSGFLKSPGTAGLVSPDAHEVDLRSLELEAARLREESQRIENEVLKARLEKLKSLPSASQ